jgi:hypothetical protein
MEPLQQIAGQITCLLRDRVISLPGPRDESV